MRKIFKSIYIQASILYASLGVLPRAINFLLLPIYLKYISVDQFGLLALITLYSGLYSVFGYFQLNISASTQYFFKNIDKNSYRKAVLFTGLILSLFTFLLFASVGHLFFSLYETKLNFYPLGFISLISATLMLWYTLFFTFMKNEYQIKKFGVFSLVLMIVGVILQVYFIVFLDWGMSGIIYGVFLSEIIVLPFLIFYSIKWLEISSDNFNLLCKYGLMSLKFSLPFLPTILLHWVQTLGDRFVLERYLSIDKIGQYAVILALITFPQMIVNSIMNAIRPKLLQLLVDKKDYLINSIEYLYVNLTVLMLSVALFFGTHLSWITSNSKYIEIDRYLFIGVLAILPHSLLYIKHLKIMTTERTGDISKFSFYGVIIQVLLLFILVPSIELYGGLIAFGLGGLITYIFNFKRVFRIKKYPFFKTVQPALLMIVIVSIAHVLVHFINLDLRLISKAINILIIVILFVIGRKKLFNFIPLFKISKSN